MFFKIFDLITYSRSRPGSASVFIYWITQHAKAVGYEFGVIPSQITVIWQIACPDIFPLHWCHRHLAACSALQNIKFCYLSWISVFIWGMQVPSMCLFIQSEIISLLCSFLLRTQTLTVTLCPDIDSYSLSHYI